MKVFDYEQHQGII